MASVLVSKTRDQDCFVLAQELGLTLRLPPDPATTRTYDLTRNHDSMPTWLLRTHD